MATRTSGGKNKGEKAGFVGRVAINELVATCSMKCANQRIFEMIFSNMTTKENIIAALKSHKPALLKLGVQTIGLFGSYVRNEQSDKSDIDLLIDFAPGKENFDNYMAAYDVFATLFKNEKIEVVTKNGLSPYIGPKILKDVVYV